MGAMDFHSKVRGQHQRINQTASRSEEVDDDTVISVGTEQDPPAKPNLD